VTPSPARGDFAVAVAGSVIPTPAPIPGSDLGIAGG
jgi:hypothetical protein